MHTHLPSCRQWKGPSCHHRICPLTYFFPTGPQCVHPASISSKTAHRAGRETGPLFQNHNITSKNPYLYKPIIKYSPGNPKTMTSITSDHYKSTLRPQLATGPRPPAATLRPRSEAGRWATDNWTFSSVIFVTKVLYHIQPDSAKFDQGPAPQHWGIYFHI